MGEYKNIHGFKKMAREVKVKGQRDYMRGLMRQMVSCFLTPNFVHVWQKGA
jgi:hypothetical protein